MACCRCESKWLLLVQMARDYFENADLGHLYLKRSDRGRTLLETSGRGKHLAILTLSES